jgi:hypothetical protein
MQALLLAESYNLKDVQAMARRISRSVVPPKQCVPTTTDAPATNSGTGFFLPLAGRDTHRAKRRTKKATKTGSDAAAAAVQCSNSLGSSGAAAQPFVGHSVAGDEPPAVEVEGADAPSGDDTAATEAADGKKPELKSLMQQLVRLLKDMGPETAHALSVTALRVADNLENACATSLPSAATADAAPTAEAVAGSLANLLGPGLLPTRSTMSV